ncbi:alpha/beta fold hydrolase [Natronoglycomyces albus]|uniref:Alpha/beta fold hydrolase n=1 Tax=Natronoglycomyces albus TaxID=2811108 RepID=A0A895XQV1_9ACTN|nr:alpha/beta fold hydrolase [Natronoglycomyces albus]QSB04650.1 alpha/beta fold hydrolase [Natronoglycomyces albus]
MRRAIAAVALSAVAATATGCAVDSTSEPAPPESLEWHECAAELGEAGLLCASVTVPLDWNVAETGTPWNEHHGETIDLALSKRPADSGDSERYALLNPGGPGASGLSVPANAEALLGTQVTEHFNLVGFDPRGIGSSAGISCQVSLATVIPGEASEFEELMSTKRSEAQQCEADNPQLGYVDTASAARDIDVIRQALGTEKISWYGWSYGTQLGATFAELFPDAVESMVLDAMYDHSRPMPDLIDEQTAAREAGFDSFAQWCDGSHDCAVAGDTAATWDDVVAAADSRPLPAEDAQPGSPHHVNSAAIADATAALLASPTVTWPMLGEAIASASEGDGSLFANMLAADDAVASMVAVRCLDWPVDDQLSDFASIAQRAEAASVEFPRFGAHAYWYYAGECLQWPHAATNPPEPYAIDEDVSILIVGGHGDPATPFTWAQTAAEAIDGASLLTFTGDGHGGSVNSECVREQTASFLLGKRADIATSCA